MLPNKPDIGQLTKDVAEIQKKQSKPAPKFSEGEILDVKGGVFRVHQVRRRRLTVDFIPEDEAQDAKLKRVQQLDSIMMRAAQSETPVTKAVGTPIPPRLQKHILRQIFANKLPLVMLHVENLGEGKTGMEVGTLTTFEAEELKSILNTPPDPVREDMTLEEKLRAYEYDELATAGEEDEKTFGPEIAAASPESGKSCEDPRRYTRYELALKLVGERHEKYALVNLVNWLLKCADDKSPPIPDEVVTG